MCEHGFVVHDVQGDNRFLCRECDERFPRHPDMIEQEMFQPDLAEAYDHLARFRDGLITFTKAIQKTRFSLEEFTAAMRKVYPPEVVYQDQYSLSSPDPIGKEIAYVEPGRTSCPAEIEKVFGNPDINLDTLNGIIFDGVFPDIQEVRHIDRPELKLMNIEIEFVDGSVQKVVIDHMLAADYGKKVNRKFQGHTYVMRPGDMNANAQLAQIDMLNAQSKYTATEKALLIDNAYKWATEKQ